MPAAVQARAQIEALRGRLDRHPSLQQEADQLLVLFEQLARRQCARAAGKAQAVPLLDAKVLRQLRGRSSKRQGQAGGQVAGPADRETVGDESK